MCYLRRARPRASGCHTSIKSLPLESLTRGLTEPQRSSTLAPPSSLAIPVASSSYSNRLRFSGQRLHPSLVLASGPVRVLVLPIRHRLTLDFSITVPCDFDTSISVFVGGLEVVIPPDVFNLGAISTGSNTCLAGAASDSRLTGSELASDNLSEDRANLGPGHWILGDVFLRNVISAWDVGGLRIGFAASES